MNSPFQSKQTPKNSSNSTLPNFINPLTQFPSNLFSDPNAFNQHLLANLASSLFLQQNVWSKFIADITLGSSLITQNSVCSQLSQPAKTEIKQEPKKQKNSFSINDIIDIKDTKSDDIPLNLCTSNRDCSEIERPIITTPESNQEIKPRINETRVDYYKKSISLIEDKLKLPLRFNYKRETIVKELTSNGVKGDVIYYSPCGKKLRNFQEIDRYLYKYYNERKQKTSNVQLTKDNFTFSSKYIVGNYLVLKETPSNNKYLSLNYPINHNTIKDLKYDVFNEKQIRSKIAELYPDFRRSHYDSEPVETNKVEIQLGLKSEIYNEPINFQIETKQNEYKKFNQIESNQLLFDSKRTEKYLHREKITRQRWFEYIMSQYTDKQLQADSSANNFEQYSRVIDSQIDDMKQKYLNKIPEFDSLNKKYNFNDLNWLGDSLQVIEFLRNFSHKLIEAINLINDQFDVDLTPLSLSLKNFYLALKNLKYKKQLNELVVVFLTILLQNESDDDLNDDDESYLLANIRHFDLNESTFSEILRLYFLKSKKNLEIHRKRVSFNLDVTENLVKKLDFFVQELNTNNFDYIEINTKSAILAHLCDDTLQNSGLYDMPVGDQDPRETNLIVDFIDESIEKLNKLRQDKIQLESKIRHSKLSNVDKKLEKKKFTINQEITECLKLIRSAHNFGQDRYKRSYFKLNNVKDILVESNFEDDILDKTSDYDQVRDCIDDLVNQVDEKNEKEIIFERFGHLIEVNEDPFSIKLKTDEPDLMTLGFEQIEVLVKNILQFDSKQKINDNYTSESRSSSSKWWSCDQDKRLKVLNSLSKRGVRERVLFKNLDLYESNETVENDLFDGFESFSVINYNKLIHKDKIKALKQIYSLENKVYSANLQIAGKTDFGEKDYDDSEMDDEDTEIIHLAKNRLLNLEKSIDKRYLKYPFSFKKKLSNYKLKITNEQDGLFLDKIDEIMENRESNLSIDLNEKLNEYLKDMDFEKSRGEEGGEHDNETSIELLRWRRLVNGSKTTSQLSLYLNELSKLIEWDKSIMKANCHICDKDNNEEKLLLCDNCDIGYHTYCFKPKIEKIPEGDWYCFKCISKFLNHKQMCFVCGLDNNLNTDYENRQSRHNINSQHSLNKCEKCSRMFHSKCLPDAKFFKTTSKWHCLNCQSNKSRTNKEEDNSAPESVKPPPKKKGRKRKYPLQEKSEIKNDDETESKKSKDDQADGKSETISDVVSESQSDKKFYSFSEKLTMKKLKQQNESDLYKCRCLLNELVRNKSASYFMEKVNEKDYPDYYDVIKEPIDLSMIKEKLRAKKYENKEQFAYDCRLIFDNCECFNEDNSQIGQAGHKLRAFFETKWLRLFD